MIKDLRTKYELTQQDFANKIGVPLRTVRSWELEERTAPDYVYNLIEYYLKHETVYITRDREAGNEIDEFDTLEAAQEAIKKYEEDDKSNDCYEEDFYDIKMTFKCHDKFILMYGDDNNGDVKIFEKLEDAKSFADDLTKHMTNKELKNHYCTLYEFDNINKLRRFYDCPNDSLAIKIKSL